MKKAIIVLAAAASLYAQTAQTAQTEVPSIDIKISCRESFDDVKNIHPRDAAADRTYALVEARIRELEALPKDKRKGEQYETELRLCNLSVDVFRTQLEKADLNQKIINTQKEILKVKDSLIDLLADDAKALDASLDRLRKESQKALAAKDSQLAKQKEEANKKLDALQSKTIKVYRDARGTILSMSGDILFETAKADLEPPLKENLAEVAAILKNLLTDARVVIEGHTDNVGAVQSNKSLSERRARAVLNYLAERGVDKKRLRAVGYGQAKPVADNGTEEGKAKNRRVELVIGK
jgi:outer membrane protein OmpA-like peptidoglycan-associated protein